MFYVGLDEIRQQKVRAAGASSSSPASVHVNGGIDGDHFAIGIGNRQPLFTYRHASGQCNSQRIHVYERRWSEFYADCRCGSGCETAASNGQRRAAARRGAYGRNAERNVNQLDYRESRRR